MVDVYRVNFNMNDDLAATIPVDFAEFLFSRYGPYFHVLENGQEKTNIENELAIFCSARSEESDEHLTHWVEQAANAVRLGQDVVFRFE